AASSGSAAGLAGIFSTSTPPPQPPPRVIEPPPPRLGSPGLTSTGPGTPGRAMDQVRREKLFAVLAREGKQASLEPAATELLGIKSGGRPVSAIQLSAIEGKTKA